MPRYYGTIKTYNNDNTNERRNMKTQVNNLIFMESAPMQEKRVYPKII